MTFVFEGADFGLEEVVPIKQEAIHLEAQQENRAAKWYKPDEEEGSEDLSDEELVIDLDNVVSLITSVNSDLDFETGKSVLDWVVANINYRSPAIDFNEMMDCAKEVLDKAMEIINTVEGLAKEAGELAKKVKKSTKNKDEDDEDESEEVSRAAECKKLLSSKLFRRFKEKAMLLKTSLEAEEEEEDTEEVNFKYIVDSLASVKKLTRSKLEKLINQSLSLNLKGVALYIKVSQASFEIDSYTNELCMTAQSWMRAIRYWRQARDYFKSAEWTNEFPEDIDENLKESLNNFNVNNDNIIDLYLSLMDELKKTCQNTVTNYISCIECEKTGVVYGSNFLKELLLDKSSELGPAKIATKLIDILYNHTPVISALMKHRFYANVKLPSMSDLYKVTVRLNGAKRQLQFMQYCYYVATNEGIEKCNSLMYEEKQSNRLKLFAPVDELKINDEVSTEVKIVYNRLLVQIGLAKFEKGDIKGTQEILSPLIESKHLQVLIGQGQPWVAGTDVEGKARIIMLYTAISIVPHYHLEVSKIEATYLLCYAIEFALQSARNPGTYVDSEVFNKCIKDSNNIIAGPAVTYKEHIIALYKYMEKSDASRAIAELEFIPIWANNITAKKTVEEIIKRHCVKILLYSQAGNYKSITLEYLKNRFNMNSSDISSLINETLFERDNVAAFWDTDESTLLFEHGKISKLHHTAKETAIACNKLNSEIQHQERRKGNRYVPGNKANN